MSIRNEGDQEIEFFSVSKSLQKIIQTRENGLSALSSVQFGGKITTICTRYWNDFSLDTSKEIELWVGGKKQDISLGDCPFSYHLDGYENRTNSRGYSHGLTIQGCWPNDDEFSFQFRIPAYMDELVAIAYVMIILSKTKDINQASKIWSIIIKDPYVGNAAKRLQLIIEGEDFSKNIIGEYPFMRQVLKDGLSFHIDKAKEEIAKLGLL